MFAGYPYEMMRGMTHVKKKLFAVSKPPRIHPSTERFMSMTSVLLGK
jgi:hypothetical protein